MGQEGTSGVGALTFAGGSGAIFDRGQNEACLEIFGMGEPHGLGDLEGVGVRLPWYVSSIGKCWCLLYLLQQVPRDPPSVLPK